MAGSICRNGLPDCRCRPCPARNTLSAIQLTLDHLETTQEADLQRKAVAAMRGHVTLGIAEVSRFLSMLDAEADAPAVLDVAAFLNELHRLARTAFRARLLRVQLQAAGPVRVHASRSELAQATLESARQRGRGCPRARWRYRLHHPVQ